MAFRVAIWVPMDSIPNSHRKPRKCVPTNWGNNLRNLGEFLQTCQRNENWEIL